MGSKLSNADLLRIMSELQEGNSVAQVVKDVVYLNSKSSITELIRGEISEEGLTYVTKNYGSDATENLALILRDYLEECKYKLNKSDVVKLKKLFDEGIDQDSILSWLKKNKAKEALTEGGSKTTKISPEMEKKILEGQRKSPTKNEVIGGHSSQIDNGNDLFAVEVLSENADGTKNIKFIKDFQDGNISKIKKSTIFPDLWSESKIIASIKEVGDSPIISVRARDGATWHRAIIDGVEIDVIKIGDNVVAGYPTGKVNAPNPSGF